MRQKETMTSEDYKNYSLQQLDNWVHDALTSADATPQEIYDCIVNVIQDNINSYKKQVDKSTELLSLMKGHRPIDFEVKVNKKWTVPVEIDGASGEYFITIPDEMLDQLDWEEGDELEWIDKSDGSFELKKVTKTISMDEC